MKLEQDFKPTWANPALPTLGSLQYVQAFAAAVLLAALLLWVVFAVVRDPRAIVRIGRKQVGA